MSVELKPLYELQLHDTQIRKVEKAIASLDAGDSMLLHAEQAEARLQETRKQLHSQESEYQDQHLQLKGLETKRQQHRDKLFSGTIGNPKELEYLGQEIEMLTRNKGALEEKLLLLMEEMETTRARVAAEEEKALQSRGDSDAHAADYRERSARMQGNLVELRAQREVMTAVIDESLLEKYTRMLKRTNYLAIVRVTKDECPGCGVNLTHFVARQLREGSNDVMCENCNRMLHYED